MSERQLAPDQVDALVEELRKVPLFAELRVSDLQALIGIANTDVYPAGSDLYHQGEADNTLYVILSGEVSLTHIDPQGAPNEVGSKGPGAELGESSLLLGEPHDVTVRALTDTTVITFARSDFKTLCDHIPGLFARLTPKDENARKINAPHFGWQAEDETVVIFVRQHRWSLIRSMLVPFALAVVAALIAFVVGHISAVLAALAGGLGALIVVALSFYLIIDWSDDYYVVTNKRLVHVDELPIIRQKREEAPLTAVTEIQFARNSVLAHVLDFGDLRVETFGGAVAMRDIPRPEVVKNLIQREIERVKARARASERRAIRDELQQRMTLRTAPPQAEEAAVPRSAPPPSPSPFAVFTGVIRYFFPRLREVQGDAVIWRKHWIVLWQRALFPFGGMILVIWATLNWWNRSFPFGGISDSLWWLWPVAFLGFFAWWLWIFEDWRNDLYIITSNRIIDIERVPFLLSETRREASLSRIQTTDLKILTPVARFLHFGDVIIRVPGAEIKFLSVKNPGGVQAEITRRLAEFTRLQAQNEARGRRTELSDWFAVYDQLQRSQRPATATPQAAPEEPTQNDGS